MTERRGSGSIDFVLASTIDPDGRRVVLSAERWSHINLRHPEVAPHLGEVIRAIREPDGRGSGRSTVEESFFLEWSGPGPWLRVVVHFESGEGVLMTAFPQRSR
jgi:hypothetical protein